MSITDRHALIIVFPPQGACAIGGSLRKIMLEELQRRNYSQITVKGYLRIVEAFAKHYHRSPDQLGVEEIRAYQAHLFTK